MKFRSEANMDNKIKETFRTTDYVASGDRTALAEPLAETTEPIRNIPVTTPEPVSNAPSAINTPMDSGPDALFGSGEAGNLRTQWQEIQIAFVDEPRKSVHQADELVETVTKRLTEMFSQQRTRLEEEWDKGEISTEDLRKAFRRYRALFDRLLSI
jgi:hypothetical protein